MPGLTCSKTYELRLRCRSYPLVRSRPCQIVVNTRCIAPANRAHHRYPFAESVFNDATIQPYIHNCTVSIQEGKQVNRFCVFFKRHCRLPLNKSIPGLSDVQFRGDAIVMRVGGLNGQSFVNMRGRDSVLSDYVMSK